MHESVSVTDHERPGGKYRARAILLCFIGLAVAATAAVRALWTAPSNLESARQAVLRGDWDDARKHYHLHFQQYPNDDPVRWEFAQRLIRKSPESALEQLGQISAGSEQYLRARRQIAGLSLQLGHDDVAEKTLLLLQQNANDAAVQLALAELYFRQRDFEKALVHCRRALELEPDRAKTYLLQAETLDELGRAGEMISPLRRALELDPELYAAHSNLAYACLYAGDFSCAEQHAEWCLRQAPNDSAIHRLRAQICRGRGDHQEALRNVAAALALSPNDLDARLLKADLLLFLGQADEAYEELKVLKGPPRERRRTLAALARAASLSGHSREAAEYRQELRELAAEDHLPGPLK